ALQILVAGRDHFLDRVVGVVVELEIDHVADHRLLGGGGRARSSEAVARQDAGQQRQSNAESSHGMSLHLVGLLYSGRCATGNFGSRSDPPTKLQLSPGE